MTLQVKVDILELIAEVTPPEPKKQQSAIDSSEWEEGQKAKEVEIHSMTENCVYK